MENYLLKNPSSTKVKKSTQWYENVNFKKQQQSNVKQDMCEYTKKNAHQDRCEYIFLNRKFF